MKTTLKDVLERAREERWAVPHFNISTLEMARGICEAASKLRSPLMLGTSEGERNFIGLKQAVVLIAAFREEFDLPIFLNADHSKSVAAAEFAIAAGYSSVHIDLSKKSFEENIAGTKKVTADARKNNPSISVEGELGYLVTDSSKVYKEKIVVDPATFTKPDEAVLFVEKTGVDRFAPAIGNLHGIAANAPKLDFTLLKNLRSALSKNITFVLHGGSGNSPAVFRKAIECGINNIHISTSLKLAYANALRKAINQDPDDLAFYKLFAPVVEAVRKEAEKYIKIFKSNNRF